MGDAAREELYIGGRRFLRVSNLNTTPEGGETEAIMGLADEVVGYSTTPRGLDEIAFDVIPQDPDGEYQQLRAWMLARTKLPVLMKRGTFRDSFTDCVIQPPNRATDDGAAKTTVSMRLRGKRVLRP